MHAESIIPDSPDEALAALDSLEADRDRYRGALEQAYAITWDMEIPPNSACNRISSILGAALSVPSPNSNPVEQREQDWGMFTQADAEEFIAYDDSLRAEEDS